MHLRRVSKLLVLLAAALSLASCAGLPGWRHFLASRHPHAGMAGDPAHGEDIFRHGRDNAPPCVTCHQTVEGGFGFALGPNLAGVSQRAGSRIDGMTAAEYIEDSILHPKHFVVPGYQDIMYPDFAKHFSPQDVADLVAYLMTL